MFALILLAGFVFIAEIVRSKSEGFLLPVNETENRLEVSQHYPDLYWSWKNEIALSIDRNLGKNCPWKVSSPMYSLQGDFPSSDTLSIIVLYPSIEELSSFFNEPITISRGDYTIESIFFLF